MGDKSEIEWTDATWNPIRGCTRVSEGCRNCYAERVAARFSGPGEAYHGLARVTKDGPRWTGKVRVIEKAMELPLRWQRPRLIFVNSMSDLFHPDVDDSDIARISDVMQRATQHTFQVLTKRPERMAAWGNWIPTADGEPITWPDNVWMGTSVEEQRVQYRIDVLRKVRAAVRFVSIEPLIGPLGPLDLSGIHWVIVGGESGPGARPMHPRWVKAIYEACRAQAVPFFFKQWGAWEPVVDQYPVDGIDLEEKLNGRSDRTCVLEDDGARPIDYRFEGGRPMYQPLPDRHPVIMEQVGKAKAGRLLFGRTYDEMPGRLKLDS